MAVAHRSPPLSSGPLLLPLLLVLSANPTPTSTSTSGSTPWPSASATDGAGPAAGCWLVDALTKTRPFAPYFPSAGGGAASTLRAARNEYESVQVVCNGPLTVTNLSVSALPPGYEVRVHRELYYEATNASDCLGGLGLWPDALVPEVDDWFGERRNALPFPIPAGANQAFWVDLFVPPSAPAGLLHPAPAVVVSGVSGPADRSRARGLRTHGTGPHHDHAGKGSGNTTVTVTLPLAVAVWNFTLPSTSPYATEFGFSASRALEAFYGASASAHEDERAAVTVMWQELALAHRLTLGGWMGQSGLPNVTAAPATLDWPGFERVWGPFLDGRDLAFGLRNARVTSAGVPTPFEGDFVNGSAVAQRQQGEYWAEVARYLGARGNLSLAYDYTTDEPHTAVQWAQVRARTAALRKAAPGIRSLVTTEMDKAEAEGVVADINLWVPIINFVDTKADCYPAAGSNRAAYNRSEVGTLWWYLSCMSQGCAVGCFACETGWPSYMIDHPGVRNRIMPWMTYRYAISGELYWGTNAAPASGYWQPNGLFLAGGNGDGTLTYPGTPAAIGGTRPIPLASLRLKLIRDGQEDLLYLAALEAATGSRAASLAVVARIAANAYTYSADPGDLLAARRALGDAIERAHARA